MVFYNNNYDSILENKWGLGPLERSRKNILRLVEGDGPYLKCREVTPALREGQRTAKINKKHRD